MEEVIASTAESFPVNYSLFPLLWNYVIVNGCETIARENKKKPSFSSNYIRGRDTCSLIALCEQLGGAQRCFCTPKLCKERVDDFFYENKKQFLRKQKTQFYKTLLTMQDSLRYSTYRTILTIPTMQVTRASNTLKTKLKEFQFKLIHRTIVTKKELFRFGIKANDECVYCGDRDSIEHSFIECMFTRLFTQKGKYCTEYGYLQKNIITCNTSYLHYK